MAKTGRPHLGRTSKSLARDIATMRRLHASLLKDERFNWADAVIATHEMTRAIQALEALLERLEQSPFASTG